MESVDLVARRRAAHKKRMRNRQAAVLPRPAPRQAAALCGIATKRCKEMKQVAKALSTHAIDCLNTL